jgi:hypothetical protein
MTKAEIDKYISWINAGKSFSLLREDLIRNGTPPEDVKIILQTLDDINSREKLHELNKKQCIQWIIAGTIVAIMSLIVFVAGFLPIAIMCYISFVSGLGTIFLGIKKYRNTPTQEIKDFKTGFKERTEGNQTSHWIR